jgi:hypothetical protein
VQRTHAVRVVCPPGLQNRQGGAALRLDGSIPSPLRGENACRAPFVRPCCRRRCATEPRRTIVEKALCGGLGPSHDHRAGAKGGDSIPPRSAERRRWRTRDPRSRAGSGRAGAGGPACRSDRRSAPASQRAPGADRPPPPAPRLPARRHARQPRGEGRSRTECSARCDGGPQSARRTTQRRLPPACRAWGPRLSRVDLGTEARPRLSPYQPSSEEVLSWYDA